MSDIIVQNLLECLLANRVTKIVRIIILPAFDRERTDC